jgi:hypothetical protein
MTRSHAMMRRLPRGALLALVVAVALLYPLLAPTPHRIDEAHFKLIAIGMTEAEVEAVFGVPSGAYDWAVQGEEVWLDVMTLIDWGHDQGIKLNVNQPGFTATITVPRLGNSSFGRHVRDPLFKPWLSRHGAFVVSFDADGRVTGTGNWGKTRIEPPWTKWWRKVVGE